MEKSVIYRDNQELQAADFDNQQAWARDALDHVVFDTINNGKAYSGFTLTKTGSTVVSASPGRLYNAGAVYAREDTVVLDVFNSLPVTTKKYFAVVAWGQTIEEDIQPREFLIDADTGMSEPQSVSMRETRYCNINTVSGVEAADPQFPNIDANVVLIGYILTDPTGVLSVQQATTTQIDNLGLLAGRISELEAWSSIISGAIDTLRTDLANLARQLLSYTPLTEFQKLVDIVNQLWDRVFRPGVYIFYGTDEFLDTSKSLTAGNVDGAYSARIDEGLRFPGGGVGWIGQLDLLNPSDPVIQSWDGFTLPKPSGSRVRYDCSFPTVPWLGVRILTFNFWAFTVRHLTPARWRFRAGPHYLPQPDASVWWHQGNQDAVERILSFSTETWEIVQWKETVQHTEYSVYWPRPGWDRWRNYWRDWVDVHHWAKVYNDFSHSGNHISQTFYNAQDGWMSGITLFSHKAAYGQPLSILISGCTAEGEPDHANQTLRRVVLDGPGVTACYGTPIYAGDIIGTNVIGAALLASPAGPFIIEGVLSGAFQSAGLYTKIPTYVYPLRINFPPVFLRAGEHFGIHVHTQSDHEFSFCDSTDAYQVHQGHLWHVIGGRMAMFSAATPRTLRFLAHFATWARWGNQPSPGGQLRYEVNLQPLQLAGGIGSVDVLAEHIIPAACDLNYEVQVDGVWQPFREDFTAIDGGDALLPFRVVFTGTTDLMPGVNLDESEVELTRAAASSYHHISTLITQGTPTNSIKVIVKAQDFVEANHDLVVSIHYGATNDAADVVTDEIMDDGSLMRTCTWTVSAVSSYYIKIDGATNNVGPNFVVRQRIAYST